MKRIICLLFIALMSSVHFVYGDEIKSIKLDNKGHNKEMASLPFCNVFVELYQGGGDDEQYGISIRMENISEDKIIYLFDRSYNEKTLKQMNLVYDKFFPGAKGKRIAEACDRIVESYRLLPSETKSIIYFQNNENSIKCRLPIYIARYDEKNLIIVKKARVSLAQKEVIVLDIDVDIKPDEDLIRLSEATDSLINEIGRQTFCSNKNHKGVPLETLHSIYTKSIDDFKKQVVQIINSRDYRPSDKGYKNFMAIHDKLNAINLEQLTVTSCDNDVVAKPRSTHHCQFCSLSAEDIYKRLESYYIDLHNGKTSKEQVIGDVEALYNCAQKNKIRTTGNYMSRITMYYNRIKDK